MKISSLYVLVGLAAQLTLATPEVKRQTSSRPLLISEHTTFDENYPRHSYRFYLEPPGFPDLPSATAGQRVAATAAPGLNLNDIQGDILYVYPAASHM